MIKVTALPSRITMIGRLGENEHRCVDFDVHEYLDMYPDANFTLLNALPGQTEAYPVADTEVEGTTLHWYVGSADLTVEGVGKCELICLSGGTVAKSEYYQTKIMPALDGSGVAPEPWDSWQTRFAGLVADAEDAADEAEAASQAVQDMAVDAETLDPDDPASVAKSVDPETGAVKLTFGIPRGESGGAAVSPHASVSKTGRAAVITITDIEGTTTATVYDGEDGQPGTPGQDGQDGHSPVLTASKSGTTTTIYSDGVQLAQIEDGTDGQPGAPGTPGAKGDDGYSPSASVSKSDGVATITVTDKTGTTTVTVSDGEDGQPGQPGAPGTDGYDGTTFTPAVSSAGVISWTNDGGKSNPQSVDLVAAVISALPTAVGVTF